VAIRRRRASAAAEVFDAGVAHRAPGLELSARGDEGVVEERRGHLVASWEGRWPRGGVDDELAVLRFFVGIAGDKGEEGPSEGEEAGEVPRAATAPLRRQKAARQLPGAHAVAAGEQPACLARG